MCKWGTNTPVRVKIPAHLSHTGEAFWRVMGIDSCIADIVQALQVAGIDMVSSCCGHGQRDGQIELADGRVLNLKGNSMTTDQQPDRDELRTAIARVDPANDHLPYPHIVRYCDVSPYVGEELILARDWLRLDAEVQRLREQVAVLPSETILRHYKKAAHEIGSLFCWCVENLKKFPPIEGDWMDVVKKQLLKAEPTAPPPASQPVPLTTGTLAFEYATDNSGNLRLVKKEPSILLTTLEGQAIGSIWKCRVVDVGGELVVKWDGKRICDYPSGMPLGRHSSCYTDFSRLYEHDEIERLREVAENFRRKLLSAPTHQLLASVIAERDEARRRLLSAAGDDLCRLTQEEIKSMSAGAVQIPPKEEFLASCERFHAQMAGESGVLTNCLTLAQLVAENEKLRLQLAAKGVCPECGLGPMTYLVESGTAWCHHCDICGRARDAEQMERELRQQLATVIAKLKAADKCIIEAGRTIRSLEDERDRLRKALEVVATIVAVVDGPMPTREELNTAWEVADAALSHKQ